MAAFFSLWAFVVVTSPIWGIVWLMFGGWAAIWAIALMVIAFLWHDEKGYRWKRKHSN